MEDRDIIYELKGGVNGVAAGRKLESQSERAGHPIVIPPIQQRRQVSGSLSHSRDDSTFSRTRQNPMSTFKSQPAISLPPMGTTWSPEVDINYRAEPYQRASVDLDKDPMYL